MEPLEKRIVEQLQRDVQYYEECDEWQKQRRMRAKVNSKREVREAQGIRDTATKQNTTRKIQNVEIAETKENNTEKTLRRPNVNRAEKEMYTERSSSPDMDNGRPYTNENERGQLSAATASAAAPSSFLTTNAAVINSNYNPQNTKVCASLAEATQLLSKRWEDEVQYE